MKCHQQGGCTENGRCERSRICLNNKETDTTQRLRELVEIQAREASGGDTYMVGLFNGLELALATIEVREPKFISTAGVPEQWRPMETAPTDGTMVRLLVDYSGDDACHPLEDAQLTHTIGGNTDGHTGLSEGWKFAGWSWEQDCFCEGRGKPIGWLPFAPVADGVKAVQAPAGYALVPIEPPHSLLQHLTNYGSTQGMSERDANEVLRRLQKRWAAILDAVGVKACEKCGDSGWKPNLDANGERVWTPLMNDALPCECGALARRRAAEKAATGVAIPLAGQRQEGGE